MINETKKSSMKEKCLDPVQMSGFEGKAVKALIDLMCSGEVTIKNENVMDLLAASEYLQVVVSEAILL